MFVLCIYFSFNDFKSTFNSSSKSLWAGVNCMEGINDNPSSNSETSEGEAQSDTLITFRPHLPTVPFLVLVSTLVFLCLLHDLVYISISNQAQGQGHRVERLFPYILLLSTCIGYDFNHSLTASWITSLITWSSCCPDRDVSVSL